MTALPDRTPTRARRGFTLIEMVVAIGVIVILATLAVTAFGVVTKRSERRSTESTLTLLDLALQEWESEAARSISWGVDDDPPGSTYELQADTPHLLSISELMRVLRRSPSAQTVLARIAIDRVHVYDSADPTVPAWLGAGDPTDWNDPGAAAARAAYLSGDWDDLPTVLDAWETPIRVVHPGRVARAGAPFGDDLSKADVDGTVRVDSNFTDGPFAYPMNRVEEIHGICTSRRICFVSAGPDGRFGSHSPTASEVDHAATEDNVYSYPLTEP